MNKIVLSKIGIVLFPISLTLPLSLKFSSFALVCFLITCLLNLNERLDWKKNSFNLKLLSLLYILYFLIDWFMYPFNDNQSLFYSIKLPFLLFPLVFIVSQKFILDNEKLIIKSFVIGNFVYIIYVFIYMLYFYSYLTNEPFNINGYLRYSLYKHLPQSIHHTYLGMSIVLTIMFISKTIKNHYKLMIVSLLFVISLALSSKVLNLSLIFLLFLQAFFWKKYFSYFLLLIISFFAYYNQKWLKLKIISSFESRIDIWSCCTKIINENWFFGVGKESIKNLIYSCNRSIGYYDAHNIWLQEWLSNGVLGLLLMLTLFLLLILSVKSYKNVLFDFVVIILFSGFTEHILNRQRGVFFFVFFSLFLLLRSCKEESFHTKNKILR